MHVSVVTICSSKDCFNQSIDVIVGTLPLFNGLHIHMHCHYQTMFLQSLLQIMQPLLQLIVHASLFTINLWDYLHDIVEDKLMKLIVSIELIVLLQLGGTVPFDVAFQQKSWLYHNHCCWVNSSTLMKQTFSKLFKHALASWGALVMEVLDGRTVFKGRLACKV